LFKAKRNLANLELDENSVKKSALNAKKFMVKSQADSTKFLAILKANIHDPEMELLSIETATNVLRLLVYHSSVLTKMAAEKLPAPKVADFAYATAGATASATAVVAGLGMICFPVAAPLWAAGALYLTGCATVGITGVNADNKRKEMTRIKRLCNDGK
jgi:hypothetical protein